MGMIGKRKGKQRANYHPDSERERYSLNQFRNNRSRDARGILLGMLDNAFFQSVFFRVRNAD